MSMTNAAKEAPAPSHHIVEFSYRADGRLIADPPRVTARLGDTITYKPTYQTSGIHQTRLTFPNGHKETIIEPGSSYTVTVVKALYGRVDCATSVDGEHWKEGDGSFTDM